MGLTSPSGEVFFYFLGASMLELAERIYKHAGVSHLASLDISDVAKALISFDDIPYTEMNYRYDTKFWIDVNGSVLTIYFPESMPKRRLRANLYGVLAHVYLCAVRNESVSVQWNEKTGYIIVPNVNLCRTLASYLECHPDHAKRIEESTPVFETMENFGFCSVYEINMTFLKAGMNAVTAHFYTGVWHDPDPKPKQHLPKYSDPNTKDPVKIDRGLGICIMVLLIVGCILLYTAWM